MTKEDIIKPENLVYKKPKLMNDKPMVMFIVCCFTIFVKFIEYALRITQNSLKKNKRRNDDD